MEERSSARCYYEALLQKGILAKETHERVIRFTPSQVIKKETID
jgi:acetylornithine/succinyldiaminopimelate/putrescine aminotransferase